MRSIIKEIYCSIILVLLLVMLSPVTVMATNIYEHNNNVFNEVSPKLSSAESLEEISPQNLLCSIFGHKVSKSIIQIVGASMIDFDQCEIAYIESGFCDRCSEFVEYGRTDKVNHNFYIEGSRRRCVYECGYDVGSI